MKRLTAVGKRIDGFDTLIMEKDFCPHLTVVTIKTGGMYTFAGEATDNAECFDQCLDCGQVMGDDGQWRNHQPEIISEIPF